MLSYVYSFVNKTVSAKTGPVKNIYKKVLQDSLLLFTQVNFFKLTKQTFYKHSHFDINKTTNIFKII